MFQAWTSHPRGLDKFQMFSDSWKIFFDYLEKTGSLMLSNQTGNIPKSRVYLSFSVIMENNPT